MAKRLTLQQGTKKSHVAPKAPLIGVCSIWWHASSTQHLRQHHLQAVLWIMTSMQLHVAARVILVCSAESHEIKYHSGLAAASKCASAACSGLKMWYSMCHI